MTSVFISYASSSKAATQRIVKALRAGGHDVWRDDALPPHRAYAEVLEERLRAARAVVVVWSQAALRSQWVRAEADAARLEGKLVQLSIDGTLPPMPFNQIQCANLKNWRGDLDNAEWRKVASSVDELAGAPVRPLAATVRRQRVRELRVWALVAVAVVLAIGVGLWAARDRLPLRTKPPDRVAVLPFRVEGGDASLQGFADGVLDETLGALSSDHVQALSRDDSNALRGQQADQTARRLHVALFVDGAISKVGDQIKVRVYLNDARGHTTLWSNDFERPAAEADAMQAEIAARAADVAHWALITQNKGGDALDAATTANFIQAMDEMANGGERGETLLREVIAKSPKFSLAYSLMAMEMKPSPGQSMPDLVNAKRALARKALALDPTNGEAYLFLANVSPMNAWASREALLAKGVAVEPQFAPLFHFESKFYGQVGRLQDSLVAAQRAAAVNNMFVGGGVDACIRLTHVGRFEDARPICQRADRLWPKAGYNQFNQFYLELENGEEQRALDRLQTPAVRNLLGAAGVAAWSDFLKARAARDAARARTAAQDAATAADAGKLDRRIAYMQLALVGEADAALLQAQRYYTPEQMAHAAADDYGDASLLFIAATASMRRDPRFMALAAHLGLVDYWVTSGKWPDFCAQPGLPYECKAEARRLKSSKT